MGITKYYNLNSKLKEKNNDKPKGIPSCLSKLAINHNFNSVYRQSISMNQMGPLSDM